VSRDCDRYGARDVGDGGVYEQQRTATAQQTNVCYIVAAASGAHSGEHWNRQQRMLTSAEVGVCGVWGSGIWRVRGARLNAERITYALNVLPHIARMIAPIPALSVILECQISRFGQFFPVFMPSYVTRIKLSNCESSA